jgi:hypothetical protein
VPLCRRGLSWHGRDLLLLRLVDHGQIEEGDGRCSAPARSLSQSWIGHTPKGMEPACKADDGEGKKEGLA